ncbi:hypothetical protein STVA_05100 [Allostella vacuolata]|nr:hypothetical protein STVA_05100 [Stella vacuolata]
MAGQHPRRPAGWRRLTVALACAAAVLAGAAPARAADAATACRAPAETIADFRLAESARIAADQARTEQVVHRALGTGVSLAFSGVRQRVPIYGDWAYGWVESYVTSYQLVIRGLLAGVEAGAAPWDPAVRAAVIDEMRRFVFDRFDALVVRPAELPQRLQAEWEAAAAIAEIEWRTARLRSRAAVRRFLIEQCGLATDTQPPAPGPDSHRIADARDQDGLRTRDGLPLDGASPIQALYRLEGIGPADTIFLRSTRPFGARLAILMARISEAGSAFALSSMIGVGSLTGPTFGFFSALGAVWTLDWAINRGDELLHRDTMEHDLRELVDEIEREMLAGMLGTLADALAAGAEAELERVAAVGR